MPNDPFDCAHRGQVAASSLRNWALSIGHFWSLGFGHWGFRRHWGLRSYAAIRAAAARATSKGMAARPRGGHEWGEAKAWWRGGGSNQRRRENLGPPPRICGLREMMDVP